MKKVSYVPQLQESECGLCCVNMVMRFYGDQIPMSYLYESLEVGRDGHNFSQLRGFLEKNNYECKIYKSNVSDLEKFSGSPLIVFINNSHFIVLEKINSRNVTYVDPDIGRVKKDLSEFEAEYSGKFLFANPVVNRKKISIKENSFSVYNDFFRKHIFRFGVLLIIAGISYLLSLINPVFLSQMSKQFDNLDSFNNPFLLLPLLLFLIFYFVVFTIKNIKTVNFSIKMDEHIYQKLVKKLLGVDYSFYMTRSTGDLMYRIGLMRSNREFLIDSIFRGLLDFGMIITIIGIVFIVSPFFIPYILGIGSLMFLVLNIIRKKVIQYQKIEVSETIKQQSQEYESLMAMFSIKAMKSEEMIRNLLSENYTKTIKMFSKRFVFTDLYRTTNTIFTSFAPLGIFLYLIIMNNNQFDITSVLFMYGLMNIFFTSVGSIFNAFNMYGVFKVNMNRINDIFQATELPVPKNTFTVKKIDSLEFDNVSFKYPGQKEYTLKNISFSLKSGERLGIAGATGSGKSTLLGLLLGLYQPTDGDILINGKKMSEVSTDSFRELLSFIPQDPFVFHKSIKQNIDLDGNSSDTEIIKAAKMAQIHEDINRMPMKYETVVSELGRNISGGQKQRIIIARALLNNPEIIVMDEATSAMDTLTERKITKLLKNNGKTQVIVAHRISTIKNCNQILVLDKGSLVGNGNHESLLNENGYYQSLVNSN